MLKAHSTTATVLRAVDLCCIGLGYLMAGEIASRLSSRQLFVFPEQRSSWEAQYSALFLLALLSWVAVTSYSGTYHSYRTESLPFAVRTMTRTFSLWVLMTVAGISLFKLANVSRQFTAYFLVASSLFMLVRQLATMVFMRRLRRFGYNWRTAIILGAQTSCEKFAQLLTATYPMGYRVLVKPLSDDVNNRWDGALPLLAHVDDVFIVGTDYAASSGRTGPEAVAGLLKQGKAVHIIPGLLDAKLFRQSFGDVAGIPVISLMKGQLGVLQAAAKRLADILASGLLLILLSPLFAVVALLIKLTSKGPVLFRQRRLGLNHKAFDIYKFRTMAANAEQILKNSPVLYAQYVANNFKLPKNKDPRITRLGRLLRATSLDELPQLLNVFVGNMSLVGPRPIVPTEVEKYGDVAGLFLSAKPGMTGHWQVSGRSDLLGYEKRVELDLEYIRDQSLGKDFEILLRTVPAVLRGRGAH
jgi:exopolysaccharide production protein ExoY